MLCGAAAMNPPNRTILELKHDDTASVFPLAATPNRTILELKRFNIIFQAVRRGAPNRTILELKLLMSSYCTMFIVPSQSNHTGIETCLMSFATLFYELPIEPYWN